MDEATRRQGFEYLMVSPLLALGYVVIAGEEGIDWLDYGKERDLEDEETKQLRRAIYWLRRN